MTGALDGRIAALKELCSFELLESREGVRKRRGREKGEGGESGWLGVCVNSLIQLIPSDLFPVY